jgi:hypothetical protein
LIVAAPVLWVLVSCSAPVLQRAPVTPAAPSRAPLAELWVEPEDLTSRDLMRGSGDPARAPSESAAYTVIQRDDTGFSKGFDVVDANGQKWDIKVGPEVQPEIVLSRILWALGYHQPPTYYVTDWQLAGTWDLEGQPARFRLDSTHESEGEWKWDENPFVGARALNGLVAINLLLNNWDFKASNNRVYKLLAARAEPTRRYVVQDLGASLGKSGTFLLERLSVADVAWACALLGRLSDAQLDDAFEAAGYEPEIRARFIRKIRTKIEEGLQLKTRVAGAAQ